MSKSGVRPRTIASESTWTSRSWSSRSRFGVSPTYTGRTPSAAMTRGRLRIGHRDRRHVQLDDVGPVLGDERTAPSVETGRSLDIKPAGFPEYVRARERRVSAQTDFGPGREPSESEGASRRSTNAVSE